jgi:hypothetical protein
MQPPGFRVIVVRAWRDAGGLRVRLIADGEARRQWIVGSITEAREVLESVLAELLDGPDDDEPEAPTADWQRPHIDQRN